MPDKKEQFGNPTNWKSMKPKKVSPPEHPRFNNTSRGDKQNAKNVFKSSLNDKSRE